MSKHKANGQGLSGYMRYMLEFATRWPCELCHVKVFTRQYRSVQGIIPRHQRLSRTVAARTFTGPTYIQLCKRCIAYLDMLNSKH